MKKLFLFLLTVSLFSCSGDDSNESIKRNDFNPPAWIQGTWGYSEETPILKFTSDNAYTITGNVEMAMNPNNLLTVGEEKTDAKYNITLSGGGTTNYYKFEKVSASEIKYYTQQGSNSSVTLIKVN